MAGLREQGKDFFFSSKHLLHYYSLTATKSLAAGQAIPYIVHVFVREKAYHFILKKDSNLKILRP
jgi:hypothetical protein